MPANPTTKATLELNAVDNVSATIKRVQGSVTDLTGSYDKLKGALLGLSGAIGATYLARMIEQTIEAEAALLRLSERTGDTVEALSSLTKVAKLSGTDMDSVATGMQKLAKSMAEAESGTGKAGKVFDALGVSIRDANTGALRPTQQVMQELGQKLMNMKDQTLAVAFAQEILGKNGAALLPFLYELARAGELHVKVTTEQAKQAKAFEDNLVNLKSASMDFWRHLANDMLPTMNKFLEQLVEGRRLAGGWLPAIANFGTMNPDPGAAISSANLELERLARRRATMHDPAEDASLDALERQQRQRLEFAKFLQRQNANEWAGGLGFTGDARDLRLAGGNKTNVANPFAADAGGAAGALAWTPEMEQMWQARKAAWIESEKITADAQKLLDDLVKAGEKYNATLDVQASHYRDLLDGSRLYTRELEKVNELVGTGKLTQDEANDSMRLWVEAHTKVENLGKAAEVTSQAGERMGLSFTSALDKLVFDAGRGVTALGVLRAMAIDVAKVTFAQNVSMPISAMFGRGVADLFASGGTPSIGMGIGANSDIGTGMTTGAEVGSWLHDGGIVGAEGSMRHADSRLWSGAPRFHSGLMPDEFPAVLQKGEGVFTPAQMKALGSGGHTFIVDARGADAGAVARLERFVAQMNGTLERRAVGAVRRESARRGVRTPF